MDTVVLKAYAKINLFLEVCDNRPDGYHNIESVMQSVSLFDTITIKKHPSLALSNNASLPNDEKNIAYKAAKLFFESTGTLGGADIFIEKNIPIAAGLAGGSTNAAAVLIGLNDLYSTALSLDKLCELGALIGADVPFCIRGGTYITKGIGDELTKCMSLPQCYIVVSKCGEGVSTPYAYGMIDKKREAKYINYKSVSKIIQSLEKGNIHLISAELFNRFEEAVSPLRPMVDKQKLLLKESGALAALMSGSGPSVFGIFLDQNKAANAHKKLLELGAEVFICTPVI